MRRRAVIKFRPAKHQFGYLADPVCYCSLIIYPINRFLLKPHHIGGWFTHGYLNDVLCLPLFVPMILYVQHLIGLRPHRRFPNAFEIAQCWVAFAVMFQLVLPRFPHMYTSAGDPLDMIAYFVGGVVAGWIWHVREQWAVGPSPVRSDS